MVLGMCIALLLNHESAFSRFLRLVLIFPLMIAPVIGALIWLLITNPTVGILRIPLGWIGLGDFRWSADPNWALFSLIIIDVWIYTPFVVILVLAGLRSLPKSPYESALIDGGSAWFVYWNLTLPMLAPVLLIALVFRMMTSLQEFAHYLCDDKGRTRRPHIERGGRRLQRGLSLLQPERSHTDAALPVVHHLRDLLHPDRVLEESAKGGIWSSVIYG